MSPSRLVQLSVFCFGVQCFAFETGCKIQPNQLNEYATKLVKTVSSQDTSLPDNVPIQSDFEFSLINGKKRFTGTFEAFYRPAEDDFLSIIPVPILGFDVSRDRVVIYLCAYATEKKDDLHLTIYFLRGYHLDPMKMSNFFGNVVFDPSLKIKPVPASLLGISEFRKFFLKIFRYIPFVDIYFQTFSMVQRVFANAFGDITGVGVERIELTQKFLRVSSGIDLNNPREALISRTFQLKPPELGPGADNTEGDSTRTFNNSSEDSTLKSLDASEVEYEEVQTVP